MVHGVLINSNSDSSQFNSASLRVWVMLRTSSQHRSMHGLSVRRAGKAENIGKDSEVGSPVDAEWGSSFLISPNFNETGNKAINWWWDRQGLWEVWLGSEEQREQNHWRWGAELIEWFSAGIWRSQVPWKDQQWREIVSNKLTLQERGCSQMDLFCDHNKEWYWVLSLQPWLWNYWGGKEMLWKHH